MEQSIETTQTSENDFTYELDIQGSLWGKVFGGKLGGQAGVQYSHGICLVLGPGHADVRLCHRPAGKRL